MADVLLRRGALGDVVLLGAATAAVDRPVVLVTDPRWREVAERLPNVGGVVDWPRGGEPLPPGRVIDLQRSLRTLRWPAHRRVRKHSMRRRLRMRTAWVAPRPDVPTLYAQALGVSPVRAPWIRLEPARRDTLVLLPGAAWAPKQWSPERFAAVGRRWSGPVAVLGGPGERALVHQVAEGIPGAVGHAEAGFAATFEVLTRCRVAVGGDSGLLHLAGATGASVVGLFGPTHPDDGFWVYAGEVVQRARWCRPCTLHRRERCPLGHRRCMDLAVESVWGAVQRCAG